MDDFVNQIKVALGEWGEIDIQRKLLVGISGGPDSLALAYALHQLGIPLILAHFNHQLRSTSGRDQAFVESFADQIMAEYVTDSQDVRLAATQRSWTIEQAARTLRYQFLFRQAEAFGAGAVVVGHTANDQVETMLLNLTRGAGLDGLCGMAKSTMTEWHQQMPLLRPMLGIWRDEIDYFCQTHDLKPRIDESNLSTEYSRNYMRHEIIPRLETLNPGVQQAIYRMANILQSERQVLDKVVDDAWRLTVAKEQDGAIWLTRKAFIKLLPGIQNRLLRHALARLAGDLQNLSHSHTDSLRQAIAQAPKSGRMFLGEKVILRHEGEKVRLSAPGESFSRTDGPQIRGEGIRIDSPGIYPIGEGWELSLRFLDGNEVNTAKLMDNKDPDVAYLDGENCLLPLLIRKREEGDRFEPLGMGGKTMKVSDYMINTKLPRRLRTCWPLVFCMTELAWVTGYQISDRFRIAPNSSLLVELRLIRPN
jgi:tRNA(Ile)-lysidine synthase